MRQFEEFGGGSLATLLIIYGKAPTTADIFMIYLIWYRKCKYNHWIKLKATESEFNNVKKSIDYMVAAQYVTMKECHKYLVYESNVW